MEITDPPLPSDCQTLSRRVSLDQIKSLRDAVDTLKCEYICLSRIREPLGLVGGYWNMDSEIINRIAAGSLCSAIRGIISMCLCFENMLAAKRLSPEVSHDAILFVQRARSWMLVNAIVSG
ncbi:hypothetical protein FB645_004303 [Coemansia sp. IMI 203386]|nr:hypothetical protein FB645_004303 [Coemansia sp. IMI 203386]